MLTVAITILAILLAIAPISLVIFYVMYKRSRIDYEPLWIFLGGVAAVVTAIEAALAIFGVFCWCAYTIFKAYA